MRSWRNRRAPSLPDSTVVYCSDVKCYIIVYFRTGFPMGSVTQIGGKITMPSISLCSLLSELCAGADSYSLICLITSKSVPREEWVGHWGGKITTPSISLCSLLWELFAGADSYSLICLITSKSLHPMRGVSRSLGWEDYYAKHLIMFFTMGAICWGGFILTYLPDHNKSVPRSPERGVSR